MVSDEGACCCAAGDRLQYWGLHLHDAVVVEILAHGVEYLVALEEYLLHSGIDHEVYVALAVALFGIGEGVVGLSILHLHHREGAEALAEHRYLLRVDGYLACLGAEYVALHSDEVADVEEFLEDDVIHVLVFAGAEVVAADVDLDASFGILKAYKRSLSHDAAAHDAACHAHFASLRVVLEVLLDFLAVSGYDVFSRRIGLYAAVAEGLHAVASYDFLFAQFLICHYIY